MTSSVLQVLAILSLCSVHARVLSADDVASFAVGHKSISDIRLLEKQIPPVRHPRSADTENELWDKFSRIKTFAKELLNLQDPGNSSMNNATLLYEAIKREIGSLDHSGSALSPSNDPSLESRTGFTMSSDAQTPTTNYRGSGTAAVPNSKRLHPGSEVLRKNITDSQRESIVLKTDMGDFQLGDVSSETTVPLSEEFPAYNGLENNTTVEGVAVVPQPQPATKKSLPYPSRSSKGGKSTAQIAWPALTSRGPDHTLFQPSSLPLTQNLSASAVTASPSGDRMEANSDQSFLAPVSPQTASSLNQSEGVHKAVLLEVALHVEDSRNDTQRNSDLPFASQTHDGSAVSSRGKVQEAEKELPVLGSSSISTTTLTSSVLGTLSSQTTHNEHHIFVQIQSPSTQLPANSGLVAEMRQTFWSTRAAAELSQKTPGRREGITEDLIVMGNLTTQDDDLELDDAIWDVDGAGNWSRTALLGNDSTDGLHDASNNTGREFQAKAAETNTAISSSEEDGSSNQHVRKALLALGVILILGTLAGGVVLFNLRRKRYRLQRLNRRLDERNPFGEPVVQFRLLPKESVSIQHTTDGMP